MNRVDLQLKLISANALVDKWITSLKDPIDTKLVLEEITVRVGRRAVYGQQVQSRTIREALGVITVTAWKVKMHTLTSIKNSLAAPDSKSPTCPGPKPKKGVAPCRFSEVRGCLDSITLDDIRGSCPAVENAHAFELGNIDEELEARCFSLNEDLKQRCRVLVDRIEDAILRAKDAKKRANRFGAISSVRPASI